MQKTIIFFILLTLLFNLPSYGQNFKNHKNSNYGATIERNLEAHALFDRAKDFLNSKKYQDAVLILKFIVEKYPNILIAEESNFFVPFKDKVFELIKNLPEDAKKLFLLEINSISSGLFKKAIEEMNLNLLEEIDSKYFLSEFGDDAAYQLGVFAFEKGNFIKAIQYFEKSLQHPHCSLNKEKLKLNLYYLYSATGKNSELIRSELLKKKPLLKEEIESIDKAIIEFQAIKNGTENINTKFNSFDKLFWTTIWQQQLEGTTKLYNEEIRIRRNDQRIARNNRNVENYYDEENIYNEWKKNLWYPANNSVINDKLFVLRNNNVLICYSLGSTPKILWETNIEGNSKKRPNDSYYDNPNFENNNTRIPTTREEILAFSNQIGNLMVENKGVLYAISNHENTGNLVPFSQRRWGGGNNNAKVEGNYIFAIDLKSGKKMWKLGDNTNANDPFYSAIFLHLPLETPYGLYVTFQVNNDVFSAMVTHKREVLWKKYLCSAESTYEMPLNNAAAVLGDDFLFITIDFGVIIKINAMNGNYCWIKRYGGVVSSSPNFYIIPSIKNGIEINSILYNMGNLIVLPSDQNVIYVLNSETGEELFKLEEEFTEYRRYLVGADATGFYLAGSKGVRKYAYNEKKIIWQSEIRDNFGKGVLSGTTILIPSDKNIYMIDKDSGKKLSMLSLNFGKPNIPLGNIVANGSYIISTSFDNIFVLNEVDIVIENLTTSILKNKTDEMLHRRGVLYFEKGDIERSFEDFAEAIKLCETDILKRNSYCESLLDVFEKIYEKGIDKKNIQSMQNIAKYLMDENHKSYWYFLQGEISLAANQNGEALQNFMLSFSQPNGNLKPRLIKENEKRLASGFVALLKAISLVEKKLITEEDFISSLNKLEVIPEEFILLALIEKLPSENIKKWVFKSYLPKLKQNIDFAKVKSFLACLSNSDDPTTSLSAKYYLFLQNIHLKEYWTAGVALKSLRVQNSEALIYTINGLEKLSELITKYQIKEESIENVFCPSVRQITAPPLKELWRSSKILNSRADIVLIDGLSGRPEFVEKNIFLHNKSDKKIYSCDLLTGEIKWSIELADENNQLKNDEDFKSARVYLRMEGIGVLNNNQKDLAFDFLTGKVLWSLANDKSDSLEMGSGCLIRYKPRELSVVDAFSGKYMYSLNLKDEIRKAIAYKGRLLIINASSTSISLYNLYTGELVNEINFPYSLKYNFNLLLGDKIVFQKNDNDIISYSIRSGKLMWEQNGGALGGNNLFNIDDKNILMYSQNGFIYYISGEDGKVIWSYEVKDRFKYRMLDLCPVSGNESLVLLANSQINRNNAETVAENIYFIIDMANGKLINEVKVKVNSQELMNQQYAWQVAFKGEVLPKIIGNQDNSTIVKFIRKKDSEVAVKHFIELNSSFDINFVTAKGHVFFVSSASEIFAFGNREIIEDQKQKNNILAEVFDEKK